jgi:hypothetical protein
MSDKFSISCRPRRLRQNQLVRALSSESSIEVFNLNNEVASTDNAKNKVIFHIIGNSAEVNSVLSLVSQFQQNNLPDCSHTIVIDHSKSSLKLDIQALPEILDSLHEVRLTLDCVDDGKNSILLAILLSPHHSPEPSSYFWDELVNKGVDLVIINSVLFGMGAVCSLKKVLISTNALSSSSTLTVNQVRPACLLPVGVLCTPEEQKIFQEADRLGWLEGDRICTELRGAVYRAGAQFLLW